MGDFLFILIKGVPLTFLWSLGRRLDLMHWTYLV